MHIKQLKQDVVHWQVSLVVSTTDKRSQPLVFKASIYGLRSDLLLVDFRRSSVSHSPHYNYTAVVVPQWMCILYVVT